MAHCKIPGFARPTSSSSKALRMQLPLVLTLMALLAGPALAAERKPAFKPDPAKGQQLAAACRRLPHGRRHARPAGQPHPAGPAPGIPGQATDRVQGRQAQERRHVRHGGAAGRGRHEAHRRVLRFQEGPARLCEEQGHGGPGRADLPRRHRLQAGARPARAATAPTAPASRPSTRAWAASTASTPRRNCSPSAPAHAATARR